MQYIMTNEILVNNNLVFSKINVAFIKNHICLGIFMLSNYNLYEPSRNEENIIIIG